jgi:DNA-binding NarL/FixJ family response regulator
MGSKQSTASSDGLRILVADDHESVLKRVVSVLQPHYHIVGTADSGQKLVEEAIRLQPDIIISDIMMPGVNGLEAARRLREGGSTAKLIFISVYDREEFVRACLAEGGLGFVTKARMGTDLVQAINEVMNGRQFISPTVGEL